MSCSFCGKHQDEVRKIVAGPKVYICDECIDLCNDIIAEECGREDAAEGEKQPSSWWTAPLLCPLCRLPKPDTDVLFVAARRWICRSCAELVRAVVEAEEAAHRE